MLRAMICVGVAGLLAAGTQSWENGPTLDTGLTGTVVVVNKAEASASLLDAGTGHTLAKIQTGSAPHEVAVSPDGATAIVTNYGLRQPGHTLTVIDLASMRAVRTIDLGAYHRPHGIRYFPDGTRVAVTAEVEGAVVIVDVAKGAVETAIETGQKMSHMLALSPDGSRIYVTGLDTGTLAVIDVAAGTVIGTVTTGAGAEGLDLSPDGRAVWVCNRADDTLSILDTESLAVAATVPCEGFPVRVKFTTDGRHVLVSDALAGAVAVFDAARRVETRRIALKAAGKRGPVPAGILVEPSGHWAFVADTSVDRVAALDLRKWKVIGYLTTGLEPDGLGYGNSR